MSTGEHRRRGRGNGANTALAAAISVFALSFIGIFVTEGDEFVTTGQRICFYFMGASVVVLIITLVIRRPRTLRGKQ